MTKILVVSDSHTDRQVLEDLATRYQNQVDAMFHCGDSELEPDDRLWQIFHVVKGNCDYDEAFPKEQVVTVGDEKIFITHGHLFGVNRSLEELAAAAKENGATIALYGHTHRMFAEMKDGLLILNPGSISQPRGPYQIPTYAMINADEKGYQINYYDRHHEVLPEFSFYFGKSANKTED